MNTQELTLLTDDIGVDIFEMYCASSSDARYLPLIDNLYVEYKTTIMLRQTLMEKPEIEDSISRIRGAEIFSPESSVFEKDLMIVEPAVFYAHLLRMNYSFSDEKGNQKNFPVKGVW